MSKPQTITIDDVQYVRADSVLPLKTTNESIIRTRDAGVHIGVVKSRTGNEVELTNARRLWKWEGAFTLNEVALKGIDRSKSRISAHVPTITIIGVCEILPIVAGVDLTSTEK